LPKKKKEKEFKPSEDDNDIEDTLEEEEKLPPADTKRELSKFDLDTRSLSSFDLANRLWALIGQQHSATADDY